MQLMRKMVMLSILSVGFNLPIQAAGWWDPYYTLKSMVSFKPTVWWNNYCYGTKKNFDEIIGSGNKTEVVINNDGVITSITDNKQSPVLLGRIPQSQADIDTIRDGLSQEEKVGIYTFNKYFERWLSDFEGLKQSKINKDSVIWHRYDTIDYTSPSNVDLIRIVRDLDSRDKRGEKRAYVHCKAGRGRSAAGVIAYFLLLAKKDEKIADVSVGSLEAYLQTKRPQVALSSDARVELEQLRMKLSKEPFEQILQENAPVIAMRDAELSH